MSDYLVYGVIILGFSALLIEVYRRNTQYSYQKLLFKVLMIQLAKLFVLPVGVATLISEVVSSLYVRQRPFVTLSNIKLLVPHGADGGMPSHHMVFMFSLAVMTYLINTRLGILLMILSAVSGLARISAGVHYPSDVIAGVLLGVMLSFTYARSVLKVTNFPFAHVLPMN